MLFRSIPLSPVPRWWSGLDYFSEALDGAWGFDMQIGQQWVYRKLAGANVWAVHAGDVAALVALTTKPAD